MRFKQYQCTSPRGCIYTCEDWVNKNDPCDFCNKTFEETRTIWYVMYMTMPYWLRSALDRPHRKVWRQIRHFFQRRKRGFDDSELWSLDMTIAEFIEPRLRAFIDTFQARSVPVSIEQADWLEKLEKMHKAFRLLTDESKFIPSDSEEKEIEEGLDLFREYFLHLWD